MIRVAELIDTLSALEAVYDRVSGPIVLTQEVMSENMTKIHLGDGLVVHRFTAAEDEHFHDHPWPFISTIIAGGYVEEVLHEDGFVELVVRKPGDRFHIDAHHQHRIVRLLEPVCWTCIHIQGEKVQEPAFYDPTPGGVLRRQWNEREWTILR